MVNHDIKPVPVVLLIKLKKNSHHDRRVINNDLPGLLVLVKDAARKQVHGVAGLRGDEDGAAGATSRPTRTASTGGEGGLPASE